ncbi:putative methyltransferase [Handroanthus impetiginosus]|uniref:Putative methyltransferase n=1 Tax=Handroanthus impetiginosus TaxID=429701 RepID=A0A2G9I0Z9_9LAMI|nr:putative methyltransferase [Handroanthus impetiginosus]
MAAEELDIEEPSCLHMVSAFLAMEPPDVVISFAREYGGGSVTENVQSCIWHRCISEADLKWQGPYLKRFLKKFIHEIESSGGLVMDELYEEYASYMSSLQDHDARDSRVLKTISFLFPDVSSGSISYPRSKLEVRLQCSVNMLEGDTGLLNEWYWWNYDFQQVGSGVGLVGICLSYVKASKVILTDGDFSTLANMKVNLELNHLITGNHKLDNLIDSNMVNCVCLPWESASEEDLRRFAPDIILGADVIYDPSCLPHLVRVLAILLKHHPSRAEGNKLDTSQGNETSNVSRDDLLRHPSAKGPIAYIASVIRNIDTFNYFLKLAEEANLIVTDLTEKVQVSNFLPYLRSYQRCSIRIFRIQL